MSARLTRLPAASAPARRLVALYGGGPARTTGGGRRAGRAKLRTYSELNEALTVLGSKPVPGSGPIDDHRSDALLTAAWLRTAAHRPELWQPAGMTREITSTEGWTFGVP